VKYLVSKLRRRRDEGASAVEYGLLVALIAVVIAAAVALLGTAIKSKIQTACNEVQATTATCAPPAGS
jgi:pilus assembly protein Flp/PilA